MNGNLSKYTLRPKKSGANAGDTIDTGSGYAGAGTILSITIRVSTVNNIPVEGSEVNVEKQEEHPAGSTQAVFVR